MTRASKAPDDGMRPCAICEVRRPAADFALNALCTGGLFPFCVRHVDQRESDRREELARPLFGKRNSERRDAHA